MNRLYSVSIRCTEINCSAQIPTHTTKLMATSRNRWGNDPKRNAKTTQVRRKNTLLWLSQPTDCHPNKLHFTLRRLWAKKNPFHKHNKNLLQCRACVNTFFRRFLWVQTFKHLLRANDSEKSSKNEHFVYSYVNLSYYF